MDPIASREYVVVYFHTLATEDNALSMSFLRDMYEMLDIKLVPLCQPSFLSSLQMFLLYPFFYETDR